MQDHSYAFNSGHWTRRRRSRISPRSCGFDHVRKAAEADEPRGDSRARTRSSACAVFAKPAVKRERYRTVRCPSHAGRERRAQSQRRVAFATTTAIRERHRKRRIPMHNAAAHVHRQSPLAYSHASSRRVPHPNEAHPICMHHIRTPARISPLAPGRATARDAAIPRVSSTWHMPCSTGAANHAGHAPVAEIDAHKHSSSMARGYT